MVGSLSHLNEKELEFVDVSALRLELARIQDARESADQSEFVMGPLGKLTFVRNSLLEHIADCIRSNGVLLPQDTASSIAIQGKFLGAPNAKRGRFCNTVPTSTGDTSMPDIFPGAYVQVIAGKHKGGIGRFSYTGELKNPENLPIDFLTPAREWLRTDILRKNLYQLSDEDAISYAQVSGIDFITGDIICRCQDSSSTAASSTTQKQQQEKSASCEICGGRTDTTEQKRLLVVAEGANNEASSSIQPAATFTENTPVYVSSQSYVGKGTFVRYVDAVKAQVFVESSTDDTDGSSGPKLLTLHAKKIRKLNPSSIAHSTTAAKSPPGEGALPPSSSSVLSPSNIPQPIKYTDPESEISPNLDSGARLANKPPDFDAKRW